MKPQGWSLVSFAAAAVVASVALAVSAAPAQAGLDFTDTLAAGPGSSADVRFNGSPTINTTIPYGFRTLPGDLVTVSSVAAIGTLQSARLDFSYTGLNGGITAATYAPSVGNPPYTMVVQLGSISGTMILQNIEFHEVGNPSAVVSIFALNQVFTAADANNLQFIFVPTGVSPLGVPLADRDLVDRVTLQFAFNAGSTFGVNAVVNPEPGTLALFGLGAVGLVGVVRMRRRARAAQRLAASQSQS